MIFDKIKPGLVIDAMVDKRGWERVTTDTKNSDGITITTDCKTPTGAYEHVTIYPGITFHFIKKIPGARPVHAWIDAGHRFLITTAELSRNGPNSVRMLDWLVGLEYIDRTYGDEVGRARAKNFQELAQPRPTP